MDSNFGCMRDQTLRFRAIFAFAIYICLQSASARPRLSFLASEEFDTSVCEDNPQVPYQPRWNGSVSSIDSFTLQHFGLADLCDTKEPLADRFVLAAGKPEEAPWMSAHLNVPFLIYQGNNKQGLHHHWNVGNEAMSYLMFIAQYYNCLPEITLFAHSHKEASWHRSTELDVLTKTLLWDQVTGFAMLEPAAGLNQLYLVNVSEVLVGAEASPPYGPEPNCNEVINGTLYHQHEVQGFHNGQLIARYWDSFFGPAGLGLMPERMSFQYGAEFLVRKHRILAHPRRFYLNAIAFLLDSTKSDMFTGFDAGVVYERIWHYIFGEEPYQETLAISHCELYGCEVSEA